MLIEPEDDGEERFVDAPEGGETRNEPQADDSKILHDGYDGKKREPLYAKAETSCLWDIVSDRSSDVFALQLSVATSRLCVCLSFD